jgi:hypothetical protein
LRALFRRQSANLHDREDLAAYSKLYLHEMKILRDHACQRPRSNRANPYKGDMCLPHGNAASSSQSHIAGPGGDRGGAIERTLK